MLFIRWFLSVLILSGLRFQPISRSYLISFSYLLVVLTELVLPVPWTLMLLLDLRVREWEMAGIKATLDDSVIVPRQERAMEQIQVDECRVFRLVNTETTVWKQTMRTQAQKLLSKTQKTHNRFRWDHLSCLIVFDNSVYLLIEPPCPLPVRLCPSEHP